MAAAPINTGGFKIINRLRSICLLDRIIVTVSISLPTVFHIITSGQEARNNSILNVIKPPSTRAVKRKVGYNDENEEQIENARVDFKRVQLRETGSQEMSSD